MLLASLALAACAVFSKEAAADNARFDLTGPSVEVRVTRGSVTLPIASVPNLQPGDRIWLHPNLPATQSIHYLMVLAFLRGTTNPPPDNWFTRVEAWDKKVRAEGVEVVVPDEAQQAVLFLAPVTGGDFSTLRSAIQGRPGVFVRASQDLDLAGFEQARIEKYIAAMHQLTPAEAADPKQLQEHSNVIAGALALKPNADCVKLAPEQQYTCLTQTGSQTLLDDGHGQSIVAALSSGPGSDFINQASYTSLAGSGVYSAYVGAVVDLVRIMGSLHTAQYQYIPAIAFPQQQALNLRLNTAPSFHNPKSVIVIGLPSVQATAPPPLRPTDPKSVACLVKPGLVLAVEGAPLVFSTGFAHDLVLHLNYPANAISKTQDIPLVADAFQGGLVVAPADDGHLLPGSKANLALAAVKLPSGVPGAPDRSGSPSTTRTQTAAAVQATPQTSSTGLTGTVQGLWGFNSFTGPTLPIQDAPGKGWRLAGATPVIAGQDQQVALSATGTACVQSITLDAVPGDAGKQTWKAATEPDRANTIEVALKLSALPGHDPGTLHLGIHQYGEATADSVALVAYAEPAKLIALTYHAGDRTAALTGERLGQVRQIQLAGATFNPQGGSSKGRQEAVQGPGLQEGAQRAVTLQPSDTMLQLTLAGAGSLPGVSAGDRLNAKVILDDGRTLTLATTIEQPRPSVTIIGKADVPPDSEGPATHGLAIKLGSADDLPLSDTLLFSLRSAQPFPRSGTVEIASPDGSLHTTLTIGSESLILEDPQTVLGRFEPLKSFGTSAFGPMRLRASTGDSQTSDWLPLVTLVRLPTITAITCPAANGPLAGSSASPDSGPVPQPAQGAPETAAACTLTGANLFLLDTVSPDPAFASPGRVPPGFMGNSFQVPAPTGPAYYLRLRDDPAATATVALQPGPQ